VADQSIQSDDLTIGNLFQAFYRVPDYQREYVWGEPDAKGDRGDEVEKFLRDIQAEFEEATAKDAPEYFIGTIVVCPGAAGVFDLIDGQQRTTTAFLTLCAIRDALKDADEPIPSTLSAQIASDSTDWKGETVHRIRLDLQYEDSMGILREYGSAENPDASRDETRSIRNIVNAYETIREFLKVTFSSDPAGVRRFYGFFTNKVKLIRIETPNLSKALKIFETINDRGVGLDAMDLLKNLLFMNADPNDFERLKRSWKDLTQEIYEAGEKPLRFLRYFIIANFDVDPKIREDEIYSWFTKHERETRHVSSPLKFADQLKTAAAAYRQFTLNNDKSGTPVGGLWNTRALGGSAFKQHFVLLLAGSGLPTKAFAYLCSDIEDLMFIWLIAGVPAKEYDRIIASMARDIRKIRTETDYRKFQTQKVSPERTRNRKDFEESLIEMVSWDLRKFRLKYLLAKITQSIDCDAYGVPGREDLRSYMDVQNDIEHILSQQPDQAAVKEFGKSADDEEVIESLGNLMWVERSINRVIKNKPYSVKTEVYCKSQFLWARSQANSLSVGQNDKISKAAKTLPSYPNWNAASVDARQRWMAKKALQVWHLR
jgi:hypothetical protein